MFTLENILIFIFIAILLINIQTILTAFVLYFQEIEEPIINTVDLDDIDNTVKEITKPYEAILLSQGFEFQSQVSITPMFAKYSNLQHSFYYYHPVQGVHAFIDTTPMKGCLRGATISYVTFYESYNMALSYDCFAHNMMSTLDNVYMFDHYHASFDEAYTSHLKDREINGEKALRGALDKEGFYNYSQHMNQNMIENAIENDILKPINGGYKFIANLKFLKYINRSIKGYKKAKKALEQNTIINDTPPEIEPLYKSSEQVILAQQLNEKPKEPNKRNKIKVFIVSGIAFMVLFGLIGVPWTVLPIIMTVLIVHELGHFWMMRYFGYEDTSIFFIPLFGAAAKGEKNDSTPFQEYMVYLAGPLPGIVISIAIGILMLIYPELRSSTLLREYALMSLVLNYINLLPIFPLDGGKIVQTLLFTRYPKAQFYFFLLSLLVIIFIGFMMESIFLGVFAMILFFSINQHHRTAQLIDSIMKQESSIPLKQRVIEMLTTQSPYKESSLVVKGSMAKQALKILNMQKPSKLLMFLGLGFYALLVFAPLILKIAIGFL